MANKDEVKIMKKPAQKLPLNYQINMINISWKVGNLLNWNLDL